MADRTLVAYAHEHGFDIHYAHDGVDPERLGPATPTGGDDEAVARGWFEGLKSTVADGLRCGLYDETAARSYLGGRVRAFAGEREVYVASP